MFDVNSLGGKLIDNQNLKKALESGGGTIMPTIEIQATESGDGYVYTVAKANLPSQEWGGPVFVKLFLTETIFELYTGNLYMQTIPCHSFPFILLNGSGESYYAGFNLYTCEFANYDNWEVGTTVEQLHWEEHLIGFDTQG